MPKRIIDSEYRSILAKWFSFRLNQHGFPQQGNWLHLGPAGPHVVGHTTSSLATLRGNSLCYYVDIDTRWIKRLSVRTDKTEMNMYISHVLEQAVHILKTQDISCIMSTPKLLPLLADRFDLSRLKGIALGGTHVTPAFNKLIRTEIAPGVPICIVYGNTLMGVAPQLPQQSDDWMLRFYGINPFFYIQVVKPDSPFEQVPYNSRGRVMMTTLTKDYFIPNLLERDEAIRLAPCKEFPWDGVSDVRPFAGLDKPIVEGVY